MLPAQGCGRSEEPGFVLALCQHNCNGHILSDRTRATKQGWPEARRAVVVGVDHDQNGAVLAGPPGGQFDGIFQV